MWRESFRRCLPECTTYKVGQKSTDISQLAIVCGSEENILFRNFWKRSRHGPDQHRTSICIKLTRRITKTESHNNYYYLNKTKFIVYTPKKILFSRTFLSIKTYNRKIPELTEKRMPALWFWFFLENVECLLRSWVKMVYPHSGSASGKLDPDPDLSEADPEWGYPPWGDRRVRASPGAGSGSALKWKAGSGSALK